MSKRFIDYYLDAVTKKEGSGGGGGDTPTGSVTLELNGTYDVKKKATAVVDVQGGVASYADPVTPSGYTEYTPKENQYVTQSDIADITPGDSTFQRQFPVDTVVAKGDKAAFVGTVRNTTAEKYCIYGTVTYTAKFSSYVNIRIGVEGVIVGGRLAPSNVITKNGVHDVKGRNSVNVNVPANVGYLDVTSNGEYYAQDDNYDGYSEVSVNVPSTYTPSSEAYTQIDDHYNTRTSSFLEAVYANPAQNPFENITLHDPLAQGEKVIINGEVGDAETYTHQGDYYLWGVVDSYDESTSTLTLSAVEGMSYTGIDATTGDGYSRTIFTQNAEYANGTHRINVNVQGSSPATLIDKNINANGTYNASSDSADGYKKVVVNVPNPSSGSLSITKNGTYDVTEKASAVVNVPNPSSGTLTITENGTYDVTEKASAVVNVPNPSSGSLSITENGTYDVTEKASAVVNVPNPSSGTLTITENGTYDVTEKASAVVNVQSGGGEDSLAKDITNTAYAYENDDITSLRNYAFYYSPITSVKLPSVTTVPLYAFAHCSHLEEAVFPSATALKTHAFANTSLDTSKVDFSNVVTADDKALGDISWQGDGILTLPKLETATNLFAIDGSQTTTLKEIYLPKLQSLGGSFFMRLTNLKKVQLDALTAITGSHEIFQDDTNGVSLLITQDQTVVTLASYVALISTRNLKIYVPDALYDQYVAATNWSNLTSRLFKLSEYVES